MVEFETVQSDEITFGDNEFIEVAVKRAMSEEGADTFISLSRGYLEDGKKRYKSNFSIPQDEDVVTALIDALPNMIDED